MTSGHGEAGPWRLPGAAVEVMESLYQHRLLDTGQIHALHTPTATPRRAQQLLAQLARHGLVASARGPGALKVWHLTDHGVEAVEAIPTRPETRHKPITPAQAAGQLQAHTQAVNDVGIAYLKAARERGDEFGPLSWRHEVAHPIGPPPGGRRGELVIADALVSYLLTSSDEVRVEQRFVELDRATIPIEDLVAKLARYQRLRHHVGGHPPGTHPTPAWRASYQAFPQIQIVFAHKPRPQLERRIRLLLALYQSDPALQNDGDLHVALTLLDDLKAQGPFAPIWLAADDPVEYVDWLGQPAAPAATERPR